MAIGTRLRGILDELIATGYPEQVAERIASGDLPMDTASRMQRAEAMGFDPSNVAYHGTRADITEFQPSARGKMGPGVYTSPSPVVAGSYSTPGHRIPRSGVYEDRGLLDEELLVSEGANVMPLLLRGDRMERFEALKQNPDIPIATLSEPTTEGASELAARLEREGITGLEIQGRGSDGMRSYNVREQNTFDPSNVRSLFAAFDPEYKGSNILGGTAAGALGLTALMAPEEAEAKTPEFLASLPQLEPRDPGLIEKATDSVANFLKDIGATESDYTARQMASSLSNLADFTPIVGDVKGFAEARDAFEQGNYGEAALLGGLGLLGAIPVGGDIAAAAFKGALPLGAMRARQGDPERLIELGYLTPESATNPSAVKSAITKYEKNLKQSKGFAFRENLAAQNDAVTARQLDEFEPSIVTPEQISQGNYVLMPVMGDPSAIGLIDMVGGVPLADQVAIEGGVDFAQKFGTGPEGIAWASNLGAAKPQFKKYRDIANLTGRQPLVAYAKMLDDSSNFATGPAEIMMQQMPSLKIAKADKKKFDDELRSQYKDWPGLDAPEAMDWVMGRGDFPNIGKRRTAFSTIMAKSDYRDRGFPVYNEAIEAVLKPELIGDERYQSGFSLFTPDLDRDIFAFEGHKSYDTAMPGQFFGNLEQTVPMEVMYPRAVSKNMQRMTNPKDPIKNPPRPFSLDEAKNAVITGTDKNSPVFEIPDQYWLDGLLSAMGR